MINEHPLFEDIPAYSLGALDPETASALDAHLKTCETCRAELATYRKMSDNLLQATPPHRPPAALRSRLQKQLHETQKMPAARRSSWSLGKLAFGVAFVFLLGLNVLSLLQIRSLQNQQVQFLRQFQTAQTALAMLTYADTQSLPIDANGIGGSVLVNKSHNVAVLIVWNLPPAPNNRTYQVWLTDPNGNRTSAGWFQPRAGEAFTSQTISAQQGISKFSSIGVTLEPAGGSSQPTTDRIFLVDY